MGRVSAQQFVDLVVDPGSFGPLPSRGTTTADAVYAAELAAAQEATGLDESVLCGTSRVGGQEVVLVAGEFGFLAGSIGVVTSDLILAAFDHATEHQMPLLVSPCSGGTRMQEGTPAFVQMVKIGQAVRAHRRAGLPYLAHLRHPTTGGVLASWASLGHYTTAQPGAMVGFLGPRVQEALTGRRIEDGIQRAENLERVGVIDAVVADECVRSLWLRWLDAIGPAHERQGSGVGPVTPRATGAPVDMAGKAALADAPTDPWPAVQASRADDRPGVLDVVAACGGTAVWFSGTGDGRVDPTIKAGPVRWCGRPLMLVGMCRDTQTHHELGPAGLRIAQRAFAVAQELGLPVVTMIDTPGAELSAWAENHGLSGEIARTLGSLAELTVPTVSVILGEGGGGAALSMLPADRTLVAASGWLSPIAPEGASAIMGRSGGDAAAMARAHRIGAHDLVAMGVADAIIPEPDDWSTPPLGPEALSSRGHFCDAVGVAVLEQVEELAAIPTDERLAARRERFRAVG
ncbi:carboxyl transferase domain-containing protein [Luteococcus sanguinis]|uniref:Acetyl-coenzyme A carboxylase carboxyl transferase subunits beta/alpha n=1 Tax=Luteococcus sanguinis TaxID=174038 RepID=A0ABW1X3J3_9ACTN